MILNDFFLTLRMPVERQEEEIERIKNSPIGTILYTTGSADNTDVIDTLLKKSGIQYQISVRDFKVNFTKVSS